MDNQIINPPIQTNEAASQILQSVSQPATQPIIQPVQPFVPPTQNPSKNSNLFLIILIVVLIILGIIFGVLVTKFLSSSNNSATSSVSPITHIEGTDNWTLYSNPNVEYSIKYPPTWILLEKSQGKLIEINNQSDKTKQVGIILIEKIALTPRNYFDYGEIKNIGNISARCFSDEALNTWCYFENGKSEIISFLIIKDNDETYNLIVDKIIATFTSTSKTTRISTKQFIVGWYWGNKEQKLTGTPSTWKYKDSGKSSCWHRIGVTCK